MFEPMNFVANLKYLGIGMLGVFIVIGAIALLTMFLNKVTSNHAGQNEDKSDEG